MQNIRKKISIYCFNSVCYDIKDQIWYISIPFIFTFVSRKVEVMDAIFQNFSNLTWQQVVMWAIGGILIYLAIKKDMEPSSAEALPGDSERGAGEEDAAAVETSAP